MQPLEEHNPFWTEDQSRQTYESALQFVTPGADPLMGRFLTHPLAPAAGGDAFHGGGTHFHSSIDPEWCIMADWVGATERREPSSVAVRIIQTNAAGDPVTYAVDVEKMEAVARIPVGQVPKRVATVRMAVD